jgi:proteic killer suppression protein
VATRSGKNKALERFHADGTAPRGWRAIAATALRKLDMIEAAVALGDLKAPPGNRLEALKHDRLGQFSIRVNDKWRVCFRWSEGPEDVEIVDYH